MPSRSSAPKPLAHPPAVEVIFGLQCVTPDDLDQEAVGKALAASLPSGFTVERQVDHVNIAVKGDGKGQVEHSQSQAWSGVKVVNPKTGARVPRVPTTHPPPAAHSPNKSLDRRLNAPFRLRRSKARNRSRQLRRPEPPNAKNPGRGTGAFAWTKWWLRRRGRRPAHRWDRTRRYRRRSHGRSTA
jgi:hypothetical protein